MSEEEAIRNLEIYIKVTEKQIESGELFLYVETEKNHIDSIKKLLDLYNKEKQLRKELIDDRDKYKNALIKRIEYCNELEKDLFENCSKYVVSKDKIREEIEEIKQILIKLDYHDIKDKNEREFYKKQYMQYVVARNILQGLLEDNV